MRSFFLQQLNLKKEFDKSVLLYYFHGSIVFLALAVELLSGKLPLSIYTIVKIVYLGIIYNLCLKTQKRLYYSFWTFSIAIGIYILMGILQNRGVRGNSLLIMLYSLAFIGLFIKMYIISSPIFYPRVRWWEYDFRYRGDLHVNVDTDDRNIRGRLSDLRRGAGCLILFESLPINHTLEIKADSVSEEIKLKATIVSKREYSLGRGFKYGIRFIFKDKEAGKVFQHFSHFWRINNKAKLEAKFESKN